MTHKMTRLITCLCLIGLLLAGCGQQEMRFGAMGSQVWEEMPALTYGVLKAEYCSDVVIPTEENAEEAE